MRMLLSLLLFALATGVQADIYTYTDARGIAHFSNVPDNSRYKLIVPGQRTGRGAQRGELEANRLAQARFSALVEQAARTYQVDAALLHAVIAAESGYDASAVSHKGAIGLMQLMPETARRYGVSNSFDPEQNILGGTRYLCYLLQLFDNRLELAVAAYNAGEKAVIDHGYSIPPYRETLAYVPTVLKLQKRFRAIL